MLFSCLASAASCSAPVLERATAPLPDLDRALEILVGVARGIAAVASVPVDIIHLPQTDVEATVVVVVHGVGIAA